MAKITFRPPGSDEPGFLRRVKAVLDFQEAIKAGHANAATIKNLVAFLADFVEEDNAEDLLWDASQDQFIEMLGALGGDADPLAANGTK